MLQYGDCKHRLCTNDSGKETMLQHFIEKAINAVHVYMGKTTGRQDD